MIIDDFARFRIVTAATSVVGAAAFASVGLWFQRPMNWRARAVAILGGVTAETAAVPFIANYGTAGQPIPGLPGFFGEKLVRWA